VSQEEKGAQMRGKLFLALVAAALLGAFAVAGFAGAADRADTKVTIHGMNGDFQGRVFSDRQRCLGDRKVIVYKQKHDTQDPANDTKIGSDLSERNGDHGEWSIGNSGFRNGKFYAKVTRTDGCKGDFSRTITL
jgi:hypothetical protein